MDKLLEIANFYNNNFNGKTFRLTTTKNNVFLLSFQAEHFKHLIGLGKLTDIAQTKKPSAILFQQILNGQFKYEMIEKSRFYEQIKKRIDYYQEMQKALFTKEMIIRTLKPGKIGGIDAELMFTNTDEKYGNAHLFFQLSKTNFYEPVTFIIHSNDYYKRQDNTYKLKIFSIEEIKKGGSGEAQDPSPILQPSPSVLEKTKETTTPPKKGSSGEEHER